MSAVTRNDVIAAYDRAVTSLQLYIEAAEHAVLARLAGHELALLELRERFERATAQCDHVRSPHGSALHVRCRLLEGHDGPHDFGGVRGVP